MARRGIDLGWDAHGHPVYLEEGARATHMHVIGATGGGKTKFLEYLIRQDIRQGRGVCLLDPTGNLCRDLLGWCAANDYLERRQIALFQPWEGEQGFGFNPLLLETDDEREAYHLVVSLVNTFAQLWGGEDINKTPLLSRLLSAVLQVLVEHRLTLAEADYLTSAQDVSGVRRFLTTRLRNPAARREWEDLNGMRPREFEDRFMSVNNRLNRFVRSPGVRAVVGRTARVIDTRAFMDAGGILLCDLSMGRNQLPLEDARLLGMLLVNDLVLKAQGRPKGSRPFYLYIDECYLYLNNDIATILDRMRQYGLHLILAHQHLGQLEEAGPKIQDSILTNTRAKVVFGGLSMESATRMAEDLHAGELDLEEPKRVLSKPAVVGYEILWLENYAVSETEGEADGVNVSEMLNWGDVEAIATQKGTGDGDGSSRQYDDLYLPRSSATSQSHSRQRAVTHTRTLSQGGARGVVQSRSRNTGRGQSQGASQAMAPVYQMLPTSVYSLQEQMYKAAAALRNLPPRTALVKPPQGQSLCITVPPVKPGLASEARIEQFRQQVFTTSGFMVGRAETEAVIQARAVELERVATLEILASGSPRSRKTDTSAGAPPPPPPESPPDGSPKTDDFDDFLE